MKLVSWVLSIAVAAGLAACAVKTPQEEPAQTAVALASVEPSVVKADFSGDVFLRGAGFDANAYVLVDGQPAVSLPGVSTTLVDANTLVLHVAYAGPGHELPPGDHALAVVDANVQTAAVGLHVKQILAKVDHVRTLSGFADVHGAFLDLWAIPRDLAGAFVGPGHELAGPDGLSDLNFQWENVRVTPLGGTQSVAPQVFGVANVVYEPVGTTKPLAVSITIDQSGSMIGLGSNPVPSDPDEERITQAENFVARMSAMDQAEVIKFQGQAGAVFVVTPMTSDKTALHDGLETLRNDAHDNTPLFDAMRKSVQDVAATPGTVTKAVIVLTDGRDTTSMTTEAQVIAAAKSAQIPIFSIGLGNPNDPASLDRASLQRIADQTGGRVFFANDPSALAGIFDELTNILADSYRLESAMSFDPPLSAAGTYTVEGDIVTTVDGESIAIPMPPFDVSVLN